MSTRFVFDWAVEQVGGESLGWHAGTDFRVMLLEGTGIPDKNAGSVSDVLATTGLSEINATGYSRETLQNLVAEMDAAGGVYRHKADDRSFGELGNGTNSNIRAVLVYKGSLNSGDDGTNQPVYFKQYDADRATNGGEVTVQWTDNDTVFELDNPTN